MAKNFANGTLILSKQQYEGRGRGSNSWISPLGCLTFSFILKHDHVETLSILQVLFSMSIVEAIISKPGYEKLDINIKWPNDVYIKKKIKIGGVLVGANFIDNEYIVVIGCGLNLNNTDPTICINDYIKEFNKVEGTNLECFDQEEILGRIMNKFEEFYQILLKKGFNKELESIYYNRWLHSSQIVHLVNESKNIKIQGIDLNGFLVGLDENGQNYTLDSNGNSLDLKNLQIIDKK